MKGVVIRSFEAFVTEQFGEEVADLAMESPGLSSEGVYTSVGDYPHSDFLVLATHVAKQTNTPVNTLVTHFGEELFTILAAAHADMVANYDSAIDLLSVIESVIHQNVRKIYDNAELPQFDVIERQQDTFIHLEYRSGRPFADLAEGLINGCLNHYGVKSFSSITRHNIAKDGTHSSFKVTINKDAKDQSN